MDWFKKHVDTVIVLGGILTAVIWMNGKFSEIDVKLSEVNNRLVVIETTLILKGIMPKELAQKELLPPRTASARF